MDKTYAVLGSPKLTLQQGVNETLTCSAPNRDLLTSHPQFSQRSDLFAYEPPALCSGNGLRPMVP